MGQFWPYFGHILPYLAMFWPYFTIGFRGFSPTFPGHLRPLPGPGLVWPRPQETAEGSHLGAGSSMVMAFVLHKVSDDWPCLVGECYV